MQTSYVGLVLVGLLAGSALGCGNGSSASNSTTSSGGTASSGGTTSSAGTTSSGGSTPSEGLGTISDQIHVDNFGWRPNDDKVAVLFGHAGVSVELLSTADNSVAGTYAAGALQAADDDSGDQVSLVDISAFTSPGDYYLYVPSLNLRSYAFRIANDVYDVVGAVAMKSFYYQRCNHDKAPPSASDAMGSFAGHGGQWVDAACHLTDLSAPAGPGSADNGNLDVHGGWHDAGDYQKTLWGRGIPQMLFAYEINPGAWTDGQLNVPEGGNGVPDLLDELKWELDFYLRMQRPDGHFMTSVKGNNPTVTSPPSQSDEHRVYFDCTSPSDNGWSGGGVTILQSTSNAVLSLAHAASVFRGIGQKTIGDGYAAAAANGWIWLNGQTATGADNRLKAAAAAAVHRMDPAIGSAQAFADAFPWDTFDGQLPWSETPADSVMTVGAFHYLASSSADSAVVAKARTGIAAVVDRAFEQAGIYGGMFGNGSNAWDWSWGSNSRQSQYGANLFMAAHFNATGTHTAADVTKLGRKYLHYILGLNPLNMVYMTNMAAYGGEHSSFQIYHSWFSYTGNDGDHGNPSYDGKPSWVVEPAYPYYVDDTQASTYGPAPGLIPGGPNPAYDGTYVVNKTQAAYAYRDFSVGCVYANNMCTGASWEITEPMAAYEGPFILLVSFNM